MVLYKNALSGVLLEDCLRGFEENKRLKTTAITPEYNCMVLNNSKQMHRVTAVSPLAPSPRMTIQIWGYNPGD